MAAYTFPPFYAPLPNLVPSSWQAVAEEKRVAQAAAIPKEWRIDVAKYSNLKDVTKVPAEILGPLELEITEIDGMKELSSAILDKKYTSFQVAEAFCKRAAIAHQLTNCLTEIFFERGLSRAKELDSHLEKTGKPVGPLHGIPISLKDQFDIEGIECTIGYVSYLGRISTESCSLVKLLEDAGAILYVRTNVPQTLMRPDTVNHIFGQTVNPFNRDLSAGGSSGGEGALVAMKGSILGIGTDIGGSVRIPSAFCGLSTIKPSTSRIPYGKATNSFMGQCAILSAAGPMARSLESCSFFLEAVAKMQPNLYDATAIPLPYDESSFQAVMKKEKLTFAVMRTDGTVTPTPPLHRALELTIKALKAEGHTIVEFDGTRYSRLADVCFGLWTADGLEDINAAIGPTGESPYHIMPADAKPITVFESWQLNREKEMFQQKFLEEINAVGIDGLISAAVPHTAPVPGDMAWCHYTAMFNALDVPACVFPVTTGDASVDIMDSGYQPISDLDKDVYTNYKLEHVQGIPVTLQVVGRRWKEEACLAASMRVQQALAAAK
ncbi:amidase [Meredithblackwellia eburnea MCA 4105]